MPLLNFRSALLIVAPLALVGCPAPPATPGCDGACALPDASGDASDGGVVAVPTQSKIEHVIILWQENHTFDNYFGNYCTAAPGSNPTCNIGPGCCEAAPPTEPDGREPLVLDDQENGSFAPDHHELCEVDEIDGGKMDRFVTSSICGTRHNFSYSPASLVAPYHDLASRFALADRYFQPTAGQSSMNDMYFARAAVVFHDNAFEPPSIGSDCGLDVNTMSYDDPTIGDLLADAGVPWAIYAEGYDAMLRAKKMPRPECPPPPDDCALGVSIYPCIYDPGDIPFAYYPRFRDNPQYMRDLDKLYAALNDGTLPSVAFVRGLGYHSEHGGLAIRISDGVAFVQGFVDRVLASRYADNTLILFTYDEGGGLFDHVQPPPKSDVDGQPYGTRVPMLAIGKFARRNYVSHVVMEHSSVVKFVEWNWLGGKTGQLGTRDAKVNNVGSLLDPLATGTPVPEQ